MSDSVAASEPRNETRNETSGGYKIITSTAVIGICAGQMAEAAGFEPARGLTLNPLSRSADPRSPQVATGRDLGKRLIVWLSERRRTGMNETRTETRCAPAAQLAAAMTSRPPRLLAA